MKLIRTATLAAACALALTAPAQAADTFTLDPMHTQVAWSINHFGFSNPSGKFAMITGSLTLDQEHPEKSSVNAVIKIGNLVTGLDKLNEHLFSDKFFDVAKFPEATFTSTDVKVTGTNTAQVTGNLTIHGITKPVTLDVKLNKVGQNMMKKNTAGFSATTTVKRSDFGMTTYLTTDPNQPLLGDEVKLEIESEANQ